MVLQFTDGKHNFNSLSWIVDIYPFFWKCPTDLQDPDWSGSPWLS